MRQDVLLLGPSVKLAKGHLTVAQQAGIHKILANIAIQL
jgi:hypothetical protein